jgi:ATP/maltotriose-dependent transcriptional regulator MalT
LKYFATLGTPEAAAEAENILLTMKAQTNTPPNVVAFGIAMNAWAKSGAHDSPARIWRLFQKLKEENLEPNPVIYTTIITFFSTTKDPKYLTLATDLLSEMENSNDEKMYLDFRQYVPVLQGWLDVQDAENAERVLLRWIGRSRTNPKVGSILPETYEKVLQCWLDLGDIEKATEFLERIDELYDSKILRYRTSKSSYEKLLVAWQLSSHPMGANEVRKLETKIGHIT